MFNAVILWVRHDEGNRKYFLPELITLIRVPLMNYTYVHRLLKEEPLITSNRICELDDYRFLTVLLKHTI